MSNTAKVCWCLSCMDENQLITDVEAGVIVVLIFSRSCLLIRPISLLAGLNNRRVYIYLDRFILH